MKSIIRRVINHKYQGKYEFATLQTFNSLKVDFLRNQLFNCFIKFITPIFSK